MSFVSQALQDSLNTLNHFFQNPEQIKKIEGAVKILVDALSNNHKVISCGNGGSMCDSMHFAEELTGRFRKDRRALPALSISDPSHLSCVANDYGYDFVFSKYVEGLGQAGDVLLAISTSGNSPNVLKACEMAKAKGMKIIALTGKSGGTLKDIADIALIVESQTTDRIQEIHIKIIHIFIEGIERAIFPENY